MSQVENTRTEKHESRIETVQEGFRGLQHTFLASREFCHSKDGTYHDNILLSTHTYFLITTF
jgi:hypothetical protein